METSWIEFLQKYGSRIEKIKRALDFMQWYPEMLNVFDIKELHSSETLEKSQKEWIKLISKFDHPLDVQFFKPYFVPIQKESYDIYIDASQEELTFFQVHYFFLEPYTWHKIPIANKLSDILSNIRNIELLMKLKEDAKRRDMLLAKHHFNQRNNSEE